MVNRVFVPLPVGL